MLSSFFFFFNDTATTEIYTLSLHDALPICSRAAERLQTSLEFPGIRKDQQMIDMVGSKTEERVRDRRIERVEDRKSTRLNSSHTVISYAVFCLKKKKKMIDEKRK